MGGGQVRTERGVLPEEHPQRVDARLATAIAALQREDEATATAVLTAYMADEEELIRKVCILLLLPQHAMPFTVCPDCLLAGTA